MVSVAVDHGTVTVEEGRCLAGQPLAQALLLQFWAMWSPSQLERLYEENRGRSYERKLSFASLVDMMVKVMVTKGGSFWRVLRKASHSGELKASYQAVYGKIGRMPLRVSEALVRHSAEVLEELGGAALACAETEIPESLQEFEVVVFDGKTIKHVPHRPKSVRVYSGKVLGSRLVVALDMRRGLVRAIAASKDGYEGETNLVPRVLEQVRAQMAGRRLLSVVDRGYCDSVQFRRFTAGEGEILVRHRRSIKFERDESVAVREGEMEDGRRYWEEWGWLGGAKRGVYVRRIELEQVEDEEEKEENEKKKKKKEDPFALVTSLLDAERYPAEDLLCLYEKRKRIETVFQHMSLVFGVNEVISCTPCGTVFQAALTLVLYNALLVLICFIALWRALRAEQLSLRTICEDVRDQLVVWRCSGGSVERLERDLAGVGLEEVRARVAKLTRMQWDPSWIKQPTTYPRPPKPPRVYPRGGAVSLSRAEEALKRQRRRC